MKEIRVIGLIMVLVTVLTCVAASAEEAEDVAIEAAREWLVLVDDGEYAQSWEEAAEFFKRAIKKAEWERTLGAVRPAMGALVSRTLMDAQFTTTLPGAPDGEYVVIRFSTEFTKKKSAVETVTPMKDPDGQWRVSGYYIK